MRKRRGSIDWPASRSRRASEPSDSSVTGSVSASHGSTGRASRTARPATRESGSAQGPSTMRISTRFGPGSMKVTTLSPSSSVLPSTVVPSGNVICRVSRTASYDARHTRRPCRRLAAQVPAVLADDHEAPVPDHPVLGQLDAVGMQQAEALDGRDRDAGDVAGRGSHRGRASLPRPTFDGRTSTARSIRYAARGTAAGLMPRMRLNAGAERERAAVADLLGDRADRCAGLAQEVGGERDPPAREEASSAARRRAR